MVDILPVVRRWWNATFLPFPSLPQCSSLLFPSLPFIPLEVGRPPYSGSGQAASAVISPSGVWGGASAPAEIVFGAFKP